MKVFFRRIHLYLALAAGLIIMVTCLTGAILVFEKELMILFNKDRYYTETQGKRLPLDSLVSSLKNQDPKAKPGSIKIYSDPERTVEISYTKSVGNNGKSVKQANTSINKEKPAEGSRLLAFIDPYTGKVLETYNHRASFFYLVMDLHRWMLGGAVGKMVVGVSTLLFLVIIITGLVLWWPRNKQILKQRLKIKSGAGFKRLNHDYHVVFGFYSAIFLFIFAFTGLAWSFEWFNKGIYTITGSSMERPKAPKITFKDSSERVSTESAFLAVTAKVNNAVFYTITAPKDSTEAFSVSLLPADASHESASDTYFVDAYSGKLAGIQYYQDRNTGQRVRSAFKPIHVASIYGWPTKLIGFFVCLLGTFFPASGIIMWCNRTQKKKTRV